MIQDNKEAVSSLLIEHCYLKVTWTFLQLHVLPWQQYLMKDGDGVEYSNHGIKSVISISAGTRLWSHANNRHTFYEIPAMNWKAP